MEQLTRIVRWCQPSFFHVGEKLFHGIVMRTFCAGRDGVCRSEGLPHGMTMASEQILGKSSVIKLRRWGGEDIERSGCEVKTDIRGAAMPRKCQEITDRRSPRKLQSWTWLGGSKAWRDLKGGETWTLGGLMVVSRF